MDDWKTGSVWNPCSSIGRCIWSDEGTDEGSNAKPFLILQGMQVVRLNMSHGDHKSHKAVVDLVKEYNRLNRKCLAVMLDTKGPEVRSGDLAEPIEMKPGNCSVTLQPILKLLTGYLCPCMQISFWSASSPKIVTSCPKRAVVYNILECSCYDC